MSSEDPARQRLSLTLDAPESAADAAAVASVLRVFIVLVDATKQELTLDRAIAIRVAPFKAGSLEIPIDICVASILCGVFPPSLDLAKILELIKSVFEIKKSLRCV